MSADETLDRTSFDLLHQLSKDARLSNKQLAAILGLAPSTAHERLKRLRASGIYAGAHAEVDLRKLGFVVEALLHICLARQVPEAVTSFLDKLRTIVEVRQFLIVTGKFDLIVQVAARDTGHLRHLEYDLAAMAMVERIETSVIFESWRQHGLPAPAWLDHGAPVRTSNRPHRLDRRSGGSSPANTRSRRPAKKK